MKRVFLLLSASAFLALILLIAALSANSIYQLKHLQKQMDDVVELHNRKIEIVTNTQIASHSRADRLLRMAIERDPFARDELFLDFNHAGFLVGSGRQQLKELGLTPYESTIYKAQGELIDRILPMQEKVVDFLSRGQNENAWNVLVAEGLPMQEHLIDSLTSLREQLQIANNHALEQARNNYRHSMLLTLVFGLMATSLGLVLAWFTLKRLASNTREIDNQIRALESSRAALEVEVTHDAMTGLANRKLFYDRLKQAMLHAKRYNRMVGVLFVDLDNFKTVNDLYGHHVGDALLEEVAKRLLGSVRESDTVARAGGDEFLIMLGNLNRKEDCEAAIDKIEDSLERKANLHGVELLVSASIGHALYPDDGVTEDALIRAADASMYRVKSGQPGAHKIS